MKVGLKLEGLSEVKKGLKALSKKYPYATGHAIYAEGYEIQRNATKRAPVEFSVLRNSAYTTVPRPSEIVAEVGFGTEYAVAQHEGLTFNHPRGGEAKFLENAINERSAGMLRRLRDYIARLVERGVNTMPAPLGNTKPVVKPAPKRVNKKKNKSRQQARPKARRTSTRKN